MFTHGGIGDSQVARIRGRITVIAKMDLSKDIGDSCERFIIAAQFSFCTMPFSEWFR